MVGGKARNETGGREHLRRETSQVGVLHETPRLRAVVILGEVREGAAPKAKRDTLALHILLTHTGNHLHMRLKSVYLQHAEACVDM